MSGLRTGLVYSVSKRVVRMLSVFPYNINRVCLYVLLCSLVVFFNILALKIVSWIAVF